MNPIPWPFSSNSKRCVDSDRERNKIDHPDEIKEVEIASDGNVIEYIAKGSKDEIDAIVGSVHQAVLNNKMPVDVDAASDTLGKIAREVLVDKSPDDLFGFKVRSINGNKVKVAMNDNDRADIMLSAIHALESEGIVKSEVGEDYSGVKSTAIGK